MCYKFVTGVTCKICKIKEEINLSKNTVKEYQDVLIIIASSITIPVKKNKLINIVIRTEDQILKDLVNQLIDCYKKYPSLSCGNVMDEYDKWNKLIKVPISNVKHYINDILSTQKPQWKILAERNGWRCAK